MGIFQFIECQLTVYTYAIQLAKLYIFRYFIYNSNSIGVPVNTICLQIQKTNNNQNCTNIGIKIAKT